jgi:DNA topoisomerase I
MSKNLVIVESPAKAKTISKYLGKDFIVKASNGHIRDLPKKEIGVDVEKDFSPKYVTDSSKKKIVSELKKFAAKAESIYLASDQDKEGEAIAWHLSHVLKKEIKDKQLHRIVFNEITKKALQKAVENPGEIDMNMVNSQQARRILDRLVGYNISPILWKVIAKSLSAGRVQSVALRLICERQEIIDAFIPEEFWTIDALLKKDKLTPFKAVLAKWEGKKAKVANEEQALSIYNEVAKKDFVLEKIKETDRKIQPSPPFITSTLQQAASGILGFSAKKTMMVAQQLYEGVEIQEGSAGLITYMRTDSLRIASEALDSCRDMISERFGKDKLHETVRVFKSKKNAQDAHEAIRPTNVFRTPESMSAFLEKDQLRMYTLIWQKFVSTQMNPVSLKSKNLEISVGKAIFTSGGSTLIDKGFTEVYPHTKVILGEVIDAGYSLQDTLEADTINKTQNFTKPPAKFTEAALIKELESKGIGRPSTYASITNTIVIRKYVLLEAKKFTPTELGKAVNSFLVANFSDFFNVQFTSEMETNLDEIVFGKVEWHELLRNYYGKMQDLMGNVDIKEAKKAVTKSTDIKCDKCGNEMVIKWGRRGQFLACSNFPECKNIKSYDTDENGKVVIAKPETIGEECPKCGSELVMKSGRYGKFIACPNFPKCKFTKPVTLGIKCPDCGDGELTEKKNKKGRTFYSCTKYPDCKYLTNTKPVNKACPSCGHYYLEEKFNKDKEKFNQCPKCNTEFF